MIEQYGYAGRILKVDLSLKQKAYLSTARYNDLFLGGRGIAAKIYWDEVPPETKAFDPENRLILMTGPLAGFPGLSGSIMEVCGKSPATVPEHFSYADLGGTWGAELKFAGYDGVVIYGRAEKPVYILITDDEVIFRDASYLWGLGAIETRVSLKKELGESYRVLAIGPAGENKVNFASVTADDDATGSSGFGAVFGSKNLKAVIVKANKRTGLKAANVEGLKKLTREVYQLVDVDVAWKPWTMITVTGYPVKRKACWGCIKGCSRGFFIPKQGLPGKFICNASCFYKNVVGDTYNDPDGELSFKAHKLLDTYGLDSFVMEPLIRWLLQCYQTGILNEADTGLPLSKMGSIEFLEALVHKISTREGFGDVLAQGSAKAANCLGKDAEKLLEGQLSKAGEIMIYEPRMYITTGLFYAMEPRRAIHLIHKVSEPVMQWNIYKDKKLGYYSKDFIRLVGDRFYGSALAFDFSTYEGKALAAKKIQDRQYAAESTILCAVPWPIVESEMSADHLGDPTLHNRLVSAITGRNIDEEELYLIGERIFNLQRAIMVREGHNGRASDTLPDFFFNVPLSGVRENPECKLPGKNGEEISRKGQVVDRREFEKMKDEYYRLRGWDEVTGFQTKTQLIDLGLKDIISDLEQRGCLR